MEPTKDCNSLFSADTKANFLVLKKRILGIGLNTLRIGLYYVNLKNSVNRKID